VRTPPGPGPGYRLTLIILTGLGFAIALPAQAQPRGKPAPVTRADIDRLDKKIEDQQKRVDKLIKLQMQYLQMLAAMTEGSAPVTPEPRAPEPKADSPKADSPKADSPKAAEPKAVAASEPRSKPAVAVDLRPKKKAEIGNIVGKVTGAADAIVYVDDIVAAAKGTATMKQENKQFLPPVLVVQKGTTVQFPNLDA